MPLVLRRHKKVIQACFNMLRTCRFVFPARRAPISPDRAATKDRCPRETPRLYGSEEPAKGESRDQTRKRKPSRQPMIERRRLCLLRRMHRVSIIEPRTPDNQA